MKSRTWFNVSALLAIACAGVFAAAPAVAAEFSAEMVTTMQGKTFKGKVHVKGAAMRHESALGGMSRIVITRPDKNVSWMLQPADKTYMEMPRSERQALPGPDWEKQIDKVAVRKSLGTQTMNGQVCDKYLLTYKNKAAGTATLWMSKSLKWPVRQEMDSPRGKVVSEFRNFKVGRQRASLFEIPAGYKKSAMPGTFMGHGKPGKP